MEFPPDSPLYKEKETAIDIVIRRIMQQKNLSQSKVARAIELAPSTFHDWTYGRIPRDPGKVLRLAHYFNVEYEYLSFGEADDQEEMKNRVAKLEMENAMMRLEGVNQLSMFETEDEGKKKIQDMKESYFKQFGKNID